MTESIPSLNAISAFKANRRKVLAGMLALAASTTGLAQTGGAPNNGRVFRIGLQKSSTLTTVLRTQGTLERLLAPKGIQLTWHEFTSGLPLLEALNLGHVDFSADVADTVPIFAQAAKAELTFVAQETPSPSAQAILVAHDSPIQSVADLKGKRVGFARAAGVHYLLIAALEKAGLKFSDIEPAYLTPADGRAAFERGAIDAWVVWDPFLSAAQIQANARVLADGQGLASYTRYYLSGTKFANANADILNIVFAELQKAGQWVKQNPEEAADLLAPVWGLDRAIVLQGNSRRSYDVQSIVAGGLAEQQRIADAFFAEKLLPHAVDAQDAPLFMPEGIA